jgi:hypothetical protein
VELRALAQSYADRLNGLEPEDAVDLITEASVETPYWDDRTNWYGLAAVDPLDHALVLAEEPGGDEYLVVRFTGRWTVDDAPVDWAALEASAFGDD